MAETNAKQVLMQIPVVCRDGVEALPERRIKWFTERLLELYGATGGTMYDGTRIEIIILGDRNIFDAPDGIRIKRAIADLLTHTAMEWHVS